MVSFKRFPGVCYAPWAYTDAGGSVSESREDRGDAPRLREHVSQESVSRHPVAVPSGVRPQPLSDAETLQGALNRVQHAAHLVPQADYWVGIEGGVEERQGSMEAFAWIVVSAPPSPRQKPHGHFWCT